MRLALLILVIVIFLAGIFFLWRVYFSKNVLRELVATIDVGASAYEIEVARTTLEKAQGLAGRESLAPGTGMVFLFNAPSRLAFTMHGMRFPLDMVWIADGIVVDISKNLQPDTGVLASAYRPRVPADTVLELNAGVADADGLKIGDSVVLSYKK